MPKTVITSFGGVLPGIMPRGLPADGAQVAHNLVSNVPDFRPLGNDLTVASSQSPSNAVSMYRFSLKENGSLNSDMSTGWTLSSDPITIARGPLNLDETERSYYTFDDGSDPPRWMDVTGEDRLLGVPGPTAAPMTTPVVVDEFTTEDRTAGITAAQQAVVQAIRDSLLPVWRGATEPGSSTQGYVNYQLAMTAASTQGKQLRVYRTTSVNGANNGSLSNAYSSYSADNFTWVLDAAMQPFWATSSAQSPSWQGGAPGNYYDHICIAIPAYGLTYDVNTTALAVALAAIPMPGTTDGTKFLTAAQIQNGQNGLVDRVVAYCSSTGNIAGPKIQNLANKVVEVRTIMDGGLQGAVVAQMTAFFTKAAITTITTQELTSWAGAVFDAVLNAYNSAIPVTDYGGAGDAS